VVPILPCSTDVLDSLTNIVTLPKSCLEEISATVATIQYSMRDG
jgi:hypothetical protein